MLRRRTLLAAATALAPFAAQAQPSWAPDRPVRIIVPFPPGGPTDLVARPLAQRLGEALGSPVLVDNRGGAGGNIGANAVATSPPDGHTLLLSNVGVLAVNRTLYRSLPFDPDRDFASIALIAGAPIALVVNPQVVPATDVRSFIAWTRQQASPVPYASAGPGTPGHLAAEVFRNLSGANLTHLPYRGSAPGVQDLVGGHVGVMFDPVQSPLGHVQAGRIRALALSAPARSPALPDVPTMVEAGVAGHEMVAWWALVAPSGTPQAAIARLAAEVQRIDALPEWRDGIGRLGISPLFQGPEELDAFRRRESQRWGEAVRTSGATAE